MTRRGVSFTMTVVIAAMILVATAVTVVMGGGGFLADFFGSQDDAGDDCQYRLARVEQGDISYEAIDRACRQSVSEARWQEIKQANIRAQSEDDVTSTLTGDG